MSSAPSVKKVKTAFMFYQSEQLGKVRAEFGGDMGVAMTEVGIRLSI